MDIAIYSLVQTKVVDIVWWCLIFTYSMDSMVAVGPVGHHGMSYCSSVYGFFMMFMSHDPYVASHHHHHPRQGGFAWKNDGVFPVGPKTRPKTTFGSNWGQLTWHRVKINSSFTHCVAWCLLCFKICFCEILQPYFCTRIQFFLQQDAKAWERKWYCNIADVGCGNCRL